MCFYHSILRYALLEARERLPRYTFSLVFALFIWWGHVDLQSTQFKQDETMFQDLCFLVKYLILINTKLILPLHGKYKHVEISLFKPQNH